MINRPVRPTDLILAPSGFGVEDCVVKHGGVVVGRLYHTNSTPEQVSWFWSLLITPQPADCRGHEPTKKAAMAAFRARWDLLTEEERASASRL